MSRSNHAVGQLSTYRFPDELRVDELWVRGPVESDVDTIAPAFRDPAVGGEASLPPVNAETSRFPYKECAYMPGSQTTQGRTGARHSAPARVAFR